LQSRILKRLKKISGRPLDGKVDGRYSDYDEKIHVAYYMIGQTALEIMEDMDGTGEVSQVYLINMAKGSWCSQSM